MEINIRSLCNRANITFIQDEIIGIDVEKKHLLVKDRGTVSFTRLSINLGSISTPLRDEQLLQKNIKPLETAIAWLEKQDFEAEKDIWTPFTVIGSGLTAVELCLALRKRWENRSLQLQTKKGCKKIYPFLGELNEAEIHLVQEDQLINGPSLRCTGSRPPKWLSQSGLPINAEGRLETLPTLQVIGHPNLFATGDCAVVQKDPRPASGFGQSGRQNSLLKILSDSMTTSHCSSGSHSNTLCNSSEDLMLVVSRLRGL